MKYSLLIFILASVLYASDAALFEADRLFNEGNNLAATDYEAATSNWRNAAQILENAIAEDNLKNGPIFYNLGNIYFRLNDLGNAIYNYKKAEILMPGDTNLMRNLAIARRMRQDKVAQQENTQVMKTIFFWHYDFSLTTKEKIFLVAFGLLVILLITRLYVKHTALTWCITISALITSIFTTSICITEYHSHTNPPGVIVAGEVIARTGYSESYTPSFAEPLHAGTEFTLKDTRADWFEIQLTDGTTTWLPQNTVKLIK